MADKLYVCISLDVEEEGLFSGAYASRAVSVTNVALLKRLEPLSARFGLPPTLYCAYAVFTDPAATGNVLWMRDHCGAEIGAHLHHWSTPPYGEECAGAPERTDKLEPGLFKARLANLMQAGADAAGAPLTSFRMGRWDLKKKLMPILAQAGIKVDSSVCPLRAFKNGPDHFLAPSEPYWLETEPAPILEAPLTQIPLIPALARGWHKICAKSPGILDSFHFFGALSANPVWHSAAVMRLAAKTHFRRGGKILNLFWHSSEMLPGGSPHVPDHKAANALLAKIFSFCGWLKQEFEIEGITASQIPGLPGASFPRLSLQRAGDW